MTPAGKARLRAVLAFGVGGAGALGLAPYGIWPATLLSLAAAVLLFDRTETGRQALVTGWAYGTGYFALALLWIVEPFFVQPEVHGWMAPFALLFMAAGLSLFWAAAFRLAYAAPEGTRLLALVVALALAEFARAYVLSGFPWAGFAQIWVGHGPDQWLALLGPHGLGLLTIFAGLVLGRAVAGQAALPFRILPAIPAALLLGWGLFPGAAREPVALSDATVRLVQPNARQDQKWDPEMIPVFLDRKLGYTAQGPRPDLIVWPETSIPTLMEFGGSIYAEMTAAAQGAPVIAGAQRREDLRLYNAAFVIRDGAPQQIYDKQHLVPFGEYIPLGNLAARFGIQGFATRQGQGFSAGTAAGLMDLGPLGTALALICYEAVFPHLSHSDTRPDMLIQITNDAWFGDHSGPYQHLAQAQMRAIEQGLPMIRVANTGISAMIDPYGRITASIPLGQAGYIDTVLPRPLPQTIYAQTGDWPVFILLVLAGLGLIAQKTRSS